MKKALVLLLIALSSSLYSQNFTLTSVVVNGLNDSWCGDIEETNWPFIGCTASPDPYATLMMQMVIQFIKVRLMLTIFL